MPGLTDAELLQAVQERFYVDGRDVRWKVAHRFNGELSAEEIAGTVTPQGYRLVQFKSSHGRRTMLAHRIVVLLRDGSLPSGNMCVDHVDGDRLNNAPENLRAVSGSINHINRRKSASKVGLLGVGRSYGRWSVQTGRGYGGRYFLAVEAVKAYWAYASEVDPVGTAARKDLQAEQMALASEYDKTPGIASMSREMTGAYTGEPCVRLVRGKYHVTISTKRRKKKAHWVGSYTTLREAVDARNHAKEMLDKGTEVA